MKTRSRGSPMKITSTGPNVAGPSAASTPAVQGSATVDALRTGALPWTAGVLAALGPATLGPVLVIFIGEPLDLVFMSVGTHQGVAQGGQGGVNPWQQRGHRARHAKHSGNAAG